MKGWLTLKRESDKNRQAALEDAKRAMEAVRYIEHLYICRIVTSLLISELQRIKLLPSETDWKKRKGGWRSELQL